MESLGLLRAGYSRRRASLHCTAKNSKRTVATTIEIPPELVEDFSDIYQSMKALTFMVLAECHDPDYEAMQDKIRALFSTLEAEAFQLKLFEE